MFSKIAGYKMNIKKSLVFLCVTNKLSEIKILKHLQKYQTYYIIQGKSDKRYERTVHLKLPNITERK